ncbi:putative disease resistance protein [Nymphaea thermarum]|nr:putative disease resistance protein [Nymphaea thermarum]
MPFVNAFLHGSSGCTFMQGGIPNPSDAICECFLVWLKWMYVHARRHAGYLKNHQTNYETLGRENAELRKIETAWQETKILKVEIFDKRQKSGRRRLGSKRMKQSAFSNFQDAQGTCTCCRGLPNCWYCYRQGKADGRKHREVAVHMEKAPLEVEQVSRPREIDWAAPLNQELLDGKYLVILDDVWQGFDIRVLGVPDPLNGSKVVVISRTLDPCDAMQTGRNIKVEAMCWKDAMPYSFIRQGM